MKICEVCGGALDRRNKSGICTKNPECLRANNRRAANAWARNNPEVHRNWVKSNPTTSLLIKIRYRARVANVPFNLKATDVSEIPVCCPCCQVRLVRGSGKAHPQSPALDRIKPELGYVRGNVQWLCHRCNMLKRDASPEELMRLALFTNREAA